MSTESVRKAPISSFRIDSVDMESHLALTQLTANETLHGISQQNEENLKLLVNSRIK
jgi:hypothetical protein